jgi:hypothetical protein
VNETGKNVSSPEAVTLSCGNYPLWRARKAQWG